MSITVLTNTFAKAKPKVRFWNAVQLLFSNYNCGLQKICLVEDENIILNDEEHAKTFNQFFVESVK